MLFAVDDFDDRKWIADSGASTHMGNVDDGVAHVFEINELIFFAEYLLSFYTRTCVVSIL